MPWFQIGEEISTSSFVVGWKQEVTISGDSSVIAIGAPNLHVYKNMNNSWIQTAAIANEYPGDGSAGEVSLSDDGLVVAITADQNNGNGRNSGHARIYKNINGSWIQIGSDIDSESQGDWLHAVSLSSDGSVVAVGADNNDGNGMQSGQVRIFNNKDNQWIQIGSDIDGEAWGDNSGRSVSLSADGSIVAIGAPYNLGPIGNGHVRVYENVDGNWIKLNSDIDNDNNWGRLGDEVCLSSDGSIIAISSGGGGFYTSSGPKHIRVLENKNGAWIQIGDDIPSTNQKISLSSDGSILATGGGIYKNFNGNWKKLTNLPQGETSISSDGTVAVIGNGQSARVIKIMENNVNQKYSLSEIKDYDGNLHGVLGDAATDIITGYKYQGKLDVNNDGIEEAIYTNKISGRWVTASMDPLTGEIKYGDHGKGKQLALSASMKIH